MDDCSSRRCTRSRRPRRPAREPFKVKDLVAGRVRPQGNPPRRAGDARPDGAARALQGAKKPLAGARIMGRLHMTIQTAVLIETLVELGADVRWVSCNIFSTQDHAAAAVVVGRPKPAARRRTRRARRCSRGRARRSRSTGGARARRSMWPDGTGPTLIVDDGGDATLLVHKGVEFEKAGKVPAFDADKEPEEWGVILESAAPGAEGQPEALDARSPPTCAASPKRRRPACTASIEMMEAGTLLFPAINVNDSVTKSKFDNIYGCRHSLLDGLNRATDVMLGGKVAVVFGFGEVGKGCAQALRGQGCARHRHRDRSDLRAAGGDGRLPGQDARRRRVDDADIFITATGNLNIITAEHMAKMKDKAIVGNIGHFDNEIDMAGLKKVQGHRADQHQAAVRRVPLPGRPQRA